MHSACTVNGYDNHITNNGEHIMLTIRLKDPVKIEPAPVISKKDGHMATKTKDSNIPPSDTVKRPRIVLSKTYKIQTSRGNSYLTVGFDNDIPVEVFFNSLNPDHVQWSISLLLSLSYAMRNGSIEALLVRLRGVHDPRGGHYRPEIKSFFPSVVAEIAEILQECYKMGTKTPGGFRSCSSCHNEMVKKDGCDVCDTCDYSSCD